MLGLTLIGTSATQVQAQSPSLGAARYAQPVVSGQPSCADAGCHGSNLSLNLNQVLNGASAGVIQTAITEFSQMRFLEGRLSVLDLNDLAAFIARDTARTAQLLPAPEAAPTLGLAAGTLDFGSVLVGSPRTQTLRLTNTGRASLHVDSVTAADPAFALQQDCPADIAIDASCLLTVTYSPSGLGPVSTQALIASNAPGSPTTLILTGSGSNSAVAVFQWLGNPTALTLATTAVGSRSDARTLTLRNAGTVSGSISAITLSGNASAYERGGTCQIGSRLDAGANCTIEIVFAPDTVGAPVAQLQIGSGDASLPSALLISATAVAGVANGPAGPADNRNIGGGGCTIGATDSPFDPLWLLMLVLAAGILWRRHQPQRRTRHRRSSHVDPDA